MPVPRFVSGFFRNFLNFKLVNTQGSGSPQILFDDNWKQKLCQVKSIKNGLLVWASRKLQRCEGCKYRYTICALVRRAHIKWGSFESLLHRNLENVAKSRVGLFRSY